MSKSRLYALALVVVVAIAALVLFPKNSAQQPVSATALPVNGLTGETTAEISHGKAAASAKSSLSQGIAAPAAPASVLPKDDQADAASGGDEDDVPAGAEVSGESNSAPASADMPKPDSDKGVVLPPSEGQ